MDFSTLLTVYGPLGIGWIVAGWLFLEKRALHQARIEDHKWFLGASSDWTAKATEAIANSTSAQREWAKILDKLIEQARKQEIEQARRDGGG